MLGCHHSMLVWKSSETHRIFFLRTVYYFWLNKMSFFHFTHRMLYSEGKNVVPCSFSFMPIFVWCNRETRENVCLFHIWVLSELISWWNKLMGGSQTWHYSELTIEFNGTWSKWIYRQLGQMRIINYLGAERKRKTLPGWSVSRSLKYSVF